MKSSPMRQKELSTRTFSITQKSKSSFPPRTPFDFSVLASQKQGNHIDLFSVPQHLENTKTYFSSAYDCTNARYYWYFLEHMGEVYSAKADATVVILGLTAIATLLHYLNMQLNYKSAVVCQPHSSNFHPLHSNPTIEFQPHNLSTNVTILNRTLRLFPRHALTRLETSKRLRILQGENSADG